MKMFILYTRKSDYLVERISELRAESRETHIDHFRSSSDASFPISEMIPVGVKT